MVSAWGCRNRLVLGQEATDEKSNEITAIPKLLELLEFKGCIVNIDAMGCQTKIAAQIVGQGGDCVLGLKGNQSTLHEEVEEFFTTASAGEFANVVHDHTEEADKDHGRLEVRRYWVTEELSTLSDTAHWSALRSIGLVERECWIEDRHTVDRCVFINSIPADAALIIVWSKTQRKRKDSCDLIFQISALSLGALPPLRIEEFRSRAKHYPFLFF